MSIIQICLHKMVDHSLPYLPIAVGVQIVPDGCLGLICDSSFLGCLYISPLRIPVYTYRTSQIRSPSSALKTLIDVTLGSHSMDIIIDIPLYIHVYPINGQIGQNGLLDPHEYPHLMIPSMDWLKGTFYRKARYFMGKSMVSGQDFPKKTNP